MMKKNLCLLLSMVFVVLLPKISRGQVAFTRTVPLQVDTACQNGPAVLLDSFLAITDPTGGLTETFTPIPILPLFGTLGGLPQSIPSPGGTATVTPTGVSYTPIAGSLGLDAVSIQVSNGTTFDVTTIALFVQTAPALNVATNTTVDSGSTAAPLTYSVTTGTPLTYSISWGAAALAEGFTDTSAVLTGSPIILRVPATANANVYEGTLSVTGANGCRSTLGTTFDVTVAGLPIVTTDSVTGIAPSVARLYGTVNDNGITTTDSFYYDTSATFATATGVAGSPSFIGGGSGATTVLAPLTGLRANTTYYFYAVGTNAIGRVLGDTLSFTTTDNPPSFVNGTPQTLALCHDAGGTDISSMFAITDPDTGQKEKFTVLSGPFHGTLSGFPDSVTSTGGIVTPSGLSYAPTALYIGADSFTVKVSDGIDSTTTQVNITVSPTPSITLGADPYVLPGATTASLPYTDTTGSPLTYTINWSSPATTAGFTDITDSPLTGSPIVIAVPAGDTAGSYTGSLTVTNVGNCPSSSYPFAVNIIGTPIVVTEPATSIITTAAVLNDSVNGNGANTGVSFEYDTASTFATATIVTAAVATVSGTAGNIADSARVTGLAANTTYYFRAIGDNLLGTDTGATLTFKTQAAPTDTSSSPAFAACENSVGNNIDGVLSVLDSTAGQTLTWSVTATPANGTLNFTSYSQTSVVGYNVPSGLTYTPANNYSGTDNFSVSINDGYGDIIAINVHVTVNTLPTITVTSNPTVAYGATAANVPFDTTGAPVTYSITFDTSAHGFTNVTNAPLGSSPLSVAIPVGASTGVDSGSIVVENVNGCFSSASPFTITIDSLAYVVTDSATAISTKGATLNSTIFSNGAATTPLFRFGTSSTLLGSYVVGTPITVSGTADTTSAYYTIAFGDLTPNTEYYYRAYATNGAGIASGSLDSFKTQYVPADTSSSPAFAACENSVGDNIDGVLSVIDSTAGQTLTWSVTATPAHGTLNFVSYSQTSTVGYNVPSGLTYTPRANYSGADNFSVSIDDGYGDIEAINVQVTVNSLPTITGVTSPATAFGASTASIFYDTTGSPVSYSITFDTSAHGFSNVTGAALDSPITVAIPAGTATGTDSGSIVVENAAGCFSTAAPFVITIDSLPYVITRPATNVTTSSARLNSTIFSNGVTTTPLFKFDTSRTLTSTGFSFGMPMYIGASSDTTAAYDSLAFGSLLPNTEYYFRAYASNVAGTDSSIILDSFRTETVPVYTTAGDSAQIMVCENTRVNIDSVLSVTAADSGQTLTWSVARPAAHGNLSFNTYSVTSTVGTDTPSNWYYIPTHNYSGNDTFSITLNDGSGDTSLRTIYVTIDSLPTLTLGTDPVIANGATVASISYTATGTPMPTAYSIIFDTSAHGFRNVTDSTLTISTINIAVPSGAPTGVDSGVIILENTNGCASIPAAFTITIDSLPMVVTDTATNVTTHGVTLNSTVYNNGTVAYPTFKYSTSPAFTDATSTGANPAFILAGATVTAAYETLTDLAPNTKYYFRAFASNVSGIDSSVIVDSFTTLNVPDFTNFGSVALAVCSNSGRTAIDSILSVEDSSAGQKIVWSVYDYPAHGTLSGFSDSTSTNVGTTYPSNLYYTPAAGYAGTDQFTISINDSFGDSSHTTVYVTVNGGPSVTVTPSSQTVCNNTATTSIVFTNNVAGSNTTYTWTNNNTSINLAATGTGDTIKSFTATNTGSVTATAIITINTSTDGCTGITPVYDTIRVTPAPVFTSSFPNESICNGQDFSYKPTGTDSPSVFYWYRPAVANIANPAKSDTGSISEDLVNTSSNNVTVTYYYIDSANGCASDSEALIVVVHPTPTLTSPLTDTVCSNTAFIYQPTSPANVTYAYSTLSVSGIINTDTTGTDSISTTFVSNNGTPTTIVYVYTLTVVGSTCTNVEDVNFVISPSAVAPTISTHSPNDLCSNTMYQNFGSEGSIIPAGDSVEWRATNAQIWATGDNGQYILVNFDTPNVVATITVFYNTVSELCPASNSYTVTVGSGVSDSDQVIYYEGYLQCLDNTVTSYQWGYDDINTLDSTLLPGQTEQFLAMPTLDSTKLYWVITEKNNCMQKSYYITPAQGLHRNSGGGTPAIQTSTPATVVTLYPNPATDEINVDIKTSVTGDISVEVINLLGQRLYSTTAINNKAKINVAGLPAGTYLIDCYREGVKISAARFTKN